VVVVTGELGRVMPVCGRPLGLGDHVNILVEKIAMDDGYTHVGPASLSEPRKRNLRMIRLPSSTFSLNMPRGRAVQL